MIAMNSELIDRDLEVARLRELTNAGSQKLALLTGPRRVGKTYLLNNVWKPEDYFIFTAARTSPELNRRQVVEDFARWTREKLEPDDYPTWRTVFSLLLDSNPSHPRVIVLDEFQYLADGEKGLAEVASELNAVWERPRMRRDLLLVLTGSVISAMEGLAAGGGPLYGRADWQARLRPFDYWYTQEMVPYFDLRDKAQLYGVFGGMPRYLSAVDAERPLKDEIIRLHLEPHGEVRQLLETALDQEEGLREVPSYRAIVRSIAVGATTLNEIAQQAGLPSDAALRDKLRRLQDLGYLEEVSNYGRASNAARRYAVADPAHRFHQRFVEPNTSMLERFSPEQVWDDVVAPALDSYMGREFEKIVAQAYARLAKARKLPLVREWSRWEGSVRDGGSVEMDVVARLSDKGRYLTGSIKWNATPRGVSDYWKHLRSLERLANSGHSWANSALDVLSPMLFVAAGGFEEGFEEAVRRDGRNVILWMLEDLYIEI